MPPQGSQDSHLPQQPQGLPQEMPPQPGSGSANPWHGQGAGVKPVFMWQAPRQPFSEAEVRMPAGNFGYPLNIEFEGDQQFRNGLGPQPMAVDSNQTPGPRQFVNATVGTRCHREPP